MHIGVLFSYDVSLKDWHKSGLIDREIEIYHKLSQHHKISLITFGDSSDLKFQKKLKKIRIIPVYKFIKKRNKYINIFISLFLPFFLKSYFVNIDMLKCNQMWGSWIAVINRIFNGKKYISRSGYEMYQNELNNKGILKKIIYYFLSILSYKFSDKIIVTTKDIKKFIIKTFFLNHKKIIIIPNYINTEKFKIFGKKRNNDFLYVGRLSEEKNLFMIFQLFKGNKKKLNVLGNGILKDALIEYKDKNKININFLKNKKNDKMPYVFNRFKFFILMSKYEGHPKALLEAMACGCICIVKKSQGIKSIIKNNNNGFYIKNKVEFSQILIKIQKNITLARKISKNSSDYVEKNFSLNKIIRKELNIYK